MCIKRIWTNDTIITTKQMTSNKFCNRLWALLLFCLHAWTVNVKDGLIICMSTNSFRIAQSQATECPEITVRQKTHPRHLKTIKKLTCAPTWSSQAAQEAPGVSPNKALDHKMIKDLNFFMQAVQIYMMAHRNEKRSAGMRQRRRQRITPLRCKHESRNEMWVNPSARRLSEALWVYIYIYMWAL